MSNVLRAWVSEELEQRNWSHRELARKTGFSPSFVSKILSGERNVSADFCIRVAQALEEAPEKLLRLAGILPTALEDDPTLAEIQDLVRHLPPSQRKEALRYLRYLYQSGSTKIENNE